MPKMKTKGSAKKRFSFTGKGKIKRKKAFKSHLLTKKGTKRKRQLTHATTADRTNEKQIRKMLCK